MTGSAPTTDRLEPIVAALGITSADFFGKLPEITPLAHPDPAPRAKEPPPNDAVRSMTREQIEHVLSLREKAEALEILARHGVELTAEQREKLKAGVAA
jgi:hypothetical protein